MKHLRRFLVWLGLREDATDEQLRSFREMLGGDNAERAARIERGEEEFDPAQEPARGQTQTEHRGSGTTPDRAPGTGDTATSQPGAPSPTAGADGGRGQGETGGETEGQRAVRIERERVAFANDYRSQVGDEVAQRAITEGWDQGRMQAEFLKHLRDNRSKPLTGTTGVHMVDRSVTRQALQVAMLERSGFGLDNDLLGVSQVAHAISDRQSNAAWLVAAHRAHRAGGRLTDEASRAMDAASRFRGISLRDICAEALSMEGTRFDRYDVTEMWRYALSSASVADIFTTHFAVQFMQGFMGIPDTTVGWTRESDLPNLQKVERKQMGKSTALKKRVRGQTADHMTIDAIGEEYRLAEYAGQFFVDMQDVIDDRFGSLDVMPSEMGEAAMEIRPDLVYAILLSNPSLGRDNTALFHADHGNLHADRTLTGDDLAFARSKMSTQKKGDRLIGVTPRGLIVPDSKDHTAWELVNSADKRDNTDGKVYGVRNWAAGRFNVVSEPRLDVGVVDPDSGDFVAGQPDAQFLTAEGGRHGIEVGFLQGTGRRPTMRRFTADEGRFGMGWDIQHFVGAKALGYEGLAKMVDPAG